MLEVSKVTKTRAQPRAQLALACGLSHDVHARGIK